MCHRREHKNDCKLIEKELNKRGGKLRLGTERDLGPLPDLPPRQECPICVCVMPIHDKLQIYYDCCGNKVCGGCDLQHSILDEERADTCPFCRTALPRGDHEGKLAQLRKRVERKDPQALCNMALDYGFGEFELPVDQGKCIELLRESASLGFPPAQFQLGVFYSHGCMGLEQNHEKAIQLWEKAAKGGYLPAIDSLGCTAHGAGHHVAAMRHFRLSASHGDRRSATDLIGYFQRGFLHHGDLAGALQAMYRAIADMRSKERDEFIEYLKEEGKYNEMYDN